MSQLAEGYLFWKKKKKAMIKCHPHPHPQAESKLNIMTQVQTLENLGGNGVDIFFCL